VCLKIWNDQKWLGSEFATTLYKKQGLNNVFYKIFENTSHILKNQYQALHQPIFIKFGWVLNLLLQCKQQLVGNSDIKPT